MILLDTNALIWLLDGSPRLGARARDVLESHHPVHYSSISVLEMVIKTMTGRLPVFDDVTARLGEAGLRQLPLVGEHAEMVSEFPELVGHDPFDRALLAQARAERLTFVTSDRRLLGLGRSWIVDAQQ